jgi:hypothetical protein
VTAFKLTRDLLTTGVSHDGIASHRRTGELIRLRRGAYLQPGESEPELRHRLLIESTLALGEGESVISFGSAAVMHGLPVPQAATQRVHLTRNRADGGRIRPITHVHVARLRPDDVCVIDGLPVTSLARTFVDLARTVPLGWGVACGDQALRSGMCHDEVAEQIDLAHRRHGISRAQISYGLLNPLSQSAGESLSRVAFFEARLPIPELQVELFDAGARIATVDFLWREQGTVGEFDGKIKYGRLRRSGETPADAVFREKRREDAVRGLGLDVVRWVWPEIFTQTEVLYRLQRSFRRGRPFHQ